MWGAYLANGTTAPRFSTLGLTVGNPNLAASVADCGYVGAGATDMASFNPATITLFNAPIWMGLS